MYGFFSVSLKEKVVMTESFISHLRGLRRTEVRGRDVGHNTRNTQSISGK